MYTLLWMTNEHHTAKATSHFYPELKHVFDHLERTPCIVWAKIVDIHGVTMDEFSR